MAFEVGVTLVMVGLAASAGDVPRAALVSGRGTAAVHHVIAHHVIADVIAGGSGEGRLDLQASDPAGANEAPPATEDGAAPDGVNAEGAKRAAPPKAGAAAAEAGDEKKEGADSDAEPSGDSPAGADTSGAAPGAAGAAPSGDAASPGASATPADAIPPGAPVPPASVSGAATVEPSPGAAQGSVLPGPASADPVPPEAPAPDETEDFQVGIATDKSKPAPLDTATDDGTQVPENAQPPGQIPIPGGLSISVGTQMSFGQSTFQWGAGYARDPMVDWSLSLSPSFMFSDGTRLSANASLSQELTLPSGEDDPHALIFSDVGLGVSRPIYNFDGGPNVFGSLSVQLPTSESSRVDSLVTSVGARATVSQPVGKVFLSFGSGFRKNFHRYTHPVRDPSTGSELVTRDGLVIEDVVTGISRLGGSELAGATYFDGESNNTSVVWSNAISAFYPMTERLGFSISYNLSHSWAYESYSLEDMDVELCQGVGGCVNGVGASEGRGRRDSHGGSLSAQYQALDQLSFGLGMATGGPTRTADDKRIRFPFFNFEGEESNMTTFFISATYTESIRL